MTNPTHCTKCKESFEEGYSHIADGLCEGCLEEKKAYENKQSEWATEYEAPGTHRGRS